MAEVIAPHKKAYCSQKSFLNVCIIIIILNVFIVKTK